MDGFILKQILGTLAFAVWKTPTSGFAIVATENTANDYENRDVIHNRF